MLFYSLHFHLLLLFYFISVWFQKMTTVLVTDNNTESIIDTFVKLIKSGF